MTADSNPPSVKHRLEFRAGLVVGIGWYLLLFAGYDLGQLIYGLQSVSAETPEPEDLGRFFASSGITVLTIIPVRLGAAAGLAGAIGLWTQQRWAVIPLIVAAILMIWPVLVWFVALVFWQSVDRTGAVLLVLHIAVTLVVALGGLVWAWRGRR